MFYKIAQLPHEPILILTPEDNIDLEYLIELYRLSISPQPAARIVDLTHAATSYEQVVLTFREMSKGSPCSPIHAPLVYVGSEAMRAYFAPLRAIGIVFFASMDAAMAYSRVHTAVRDPAIVAF